MAMSCKAFIDELKTYQGNNVFNPYTGRCTVYDKANAATIRSRNLRAALNGFNKVGLDSLWIGRDLGHRGGRRTGLALTDEAHLPIAAQAWGVKLNKATRGGIVAERTAANIWAYLNRIDERIFMWNIFPFHPYQAGKPLSNRSHTARERDYGLQVLDTLIALLRPKRIIALGNDAYNGAMNLASNCEVIKIRHPSYGGEKIFARQLNELYGLRDS